jgi:hypothetical protein
MRKLDQREMTQVDGGQIGVGVGLGAGLAAGFGGIGLGVGVMFRLFLCVMSFGLLC